MYSGFDSGHAPESMMYLGFGWPSSPSSTPLRWATYLSGGPPAAFRRSSAEEIIRLLASSKSGEAMPQPWRHSGGRDDQKI